MKINIEFSRGKKSMAKKNLKNTKTVSTKRTMEFSKKLLVFDYIIAIVLLAVFFICHCINGFYTMTTIDNLIAIGVDMSMTTITAPFNLDIFGVLLASWIVQLGVSSGAYYMMAKEDHRVQIPLKLIEDMPKEVKSKVDMTQIITSALNISAN